jgi:putative DNA primase/helicase
MGPRDPPDKLVAIVLASRGDWTFPVIRGVLTCPTLRPDGSLLSTPGYDLRGRYYLAFPTNLVLPPIPDLPTRTDALESLTRLKALLAGFPFVDDVSRAVALCILMTQVLRCAMQVSPLLGVSANASGTGKSFLIDLANTIALGRPCPVITPGKNDEETEKGIRTKLLSSTPAFSIDNVHSNLNLALLNVATERPFISIRLFGVLEEIEVENSVTIYMTGNNLVIVDEQGRRTIRCCMDAGVERPEYRPFKNNPIEMVLKDRGRYIADILTIARAYITNGTKPDIVPMGDSHAAWSRLVREPLVWLGCEDPIKSQEISRENDPDSIKLGAIIGAWHHSFGLGARTLAHAIKPPVHPGHVPGETPDEKQWRQAAYEVELASHTDLLVVLREAFPSHDSGSVNTVQWGNWMRRYADGRVLNGLRFGKLKDRNGKDVLDHGAVQWALAKP